MKTYAQIKSGLIKNIFILADDSLLSNFSGGYDAVNQIDNVTPIPGIGWSWDGASYTAPAPGLPDDAYGNPVSMTTDGVTDTYLANGIRYPVAAGTSLSVVYLALAKGANISAAQIAIKAFVESKYTLDTRWSFNALYLTALQSGDKPNRMAYILQLFTWANSVTSYAATYCANVATQTSVASVLALVPDFSLIVVPDPVVTVLGAIAITG